MPVKRRTSKRREHLCEDAEKWLRGEPSGFFEFKNADELAALWAEYGDPEVAEWDDAAQKPRARRLHNRARAMADCARVKARTCWKLAGEMSCLIGRSRSRSRRPRSSNSVKA